MFDADRPITSISQDRLGRGVFAKYLARCMLDHKNPESLVIGLYGGWGTGKTSIINLTLEELRSAANNMLDGEKPIILNFSPWSYSGQGQLIYNFFRRLSSEIRQCENLENSAEIIHLLELYVSFFTQQAVPKPLRKPNPFFARLKKNPFKKTSVEKRDNLAWASGQDPTQVKARLNAVLKTLNRKIIIFIDNVSRIEAGEINQILQIVKSMGDYANTIYLLALDKNQVVNAIDETHHGEGHEYLDKLVQLPFAVPPISKQDVESLLFDRLQSVLHESGEKLWNATYWSDLYYSSLRYFFTSCRDITRYVNTLSFGFSFVRDVINPVDFFALTAIEVFAPQILYGIRENKDLFTDLLENVYATNQAQQQKDRLRCDEIIARQSLLPKEIMLQLIMQLFPRIRQIYTPGETFYHSPSLARTHYRVCSPDMFEIYFRLSIPTGTLLESEFDTLLTQTGDRDSFDQVLTRLNQDGRILRFLDLLDTTASQKIQQDAIPNVIAGLLDSADFFPEGESSALHFNTPMRIHRILHQLLQKLPNTTTRFTVLKDAILHATKSLFIIVHELNQQGKQHIETDEDYVPPEHRDMSTHELQQLRNAALEKIEYWAKIGRLLEHPKLLPILFAWKGWGHAEACEAFLRQSLYTDQHKLNEKTVLAILCAALAEPIQLVLTKQEKSSDWKKYLENITYFLPLDAIEPLAVIIFEEETFEMLREEEQLAVLIFLDLTDAKTTKLIPKTTA